MKGYCESCGRYPRLPERLLGGGIVPSEDGTVYLCPDCLRDTVSLAAVNAEPRATPWLARRKAAVGATSLVAAMTVTLLFVSVLAQRSVSGGVLGAVQPGDVPGASPHIAASPSEMASKAPASQGSAAPDRNSPGASNGGAGDLDKDAAVSVGPLAIRTWKDSFGRSRLQVIVPVRNDDARWVQIVGTSSTYRIIDAGGEAASGAFVALPAMIGPGETAYLVDTISVPGIELKRNLSAELNVVSRPTGPAPMRLSITGLRLASGVGGDMSATGLVQNDGETATRRVIAAAIALAPDGRPLGAFYDTFDIGRLEPREARTFVTDYHPGGPPIVDTIIAKLIGAAFEVAP